MHTPESRQKYQVIWVVFSNCFSNTMYSNKALCFSHIRGTRFPIRLVKMLQQITNVLIEPQRPSYSCLWLWRVLKVFVFLYWCDLKLFVLKHGCIKDFAKAQECLFFHTYLILVSVYVCLSPSLSVFHMCVFWQTGVYRVCLYHRFHTEQM